MDAVETAVFVETGTYHGWTTVLAAGLWPRVITIEQSEELLNRARVKFSDRHLTIECHHGNSGDLLPALVAELAHVPVCWYLDAHWFDRPGVIDAGHRFPLWDELAAIAQRPQPDTIVVDDVKVFQTANPIPEWLEVSPASIQAALGGEERVCWAEEDDDHFVIHRRAGRLIQLDTEPGSP